MDSSDCFDARQESLNVCSILDTPREPMFDNVVFTVAQLFRASMASLVLVARDRVWTKSEVGLRTADLGRATVFCQVVIGTGETLVVEDARADVRFARPMEALGEPTLRFCAATPVLGPGGHRIGVLCALDRQARSATQRQIMHLRQLAIQAGELLRVRVPGLDLEEDAQAGH